MSSEAAVQPKISVVILNYNGQDWLGRCFESLEAQTIYDDLEIIVVDNNSPDGSGRLAEQWLQRTGKGRMVWNEVNRFYCEANNNGAAVATGRHFLFLNNDTWLEPDCLEVLLRETESASADAATPIVLNYEDDSFQSIGGPGLDLFGLPLGCAPFGKTKPIFAACGCSYFISAEIFRRVGGFDDKLLMYADETDISWRVQIAGGKIVGVPAARLHHRGAPAVNPEGKTRMVESRTSDTKRYLSNRNGILLLLKNAQHVLLLLLVTHLLLLFMEAVVSLLFTRRWSHIQKSYIGAVTGAFRMLDEVRVWRKRIRAFRKRGDFAMLRFLRIVPSRWVELKRLFTTGHPKVDAR